MHDLMRFNHQANETNGFSRALGAADGIGTYPDRAEVASSSGFSTRPARYRHPPRMWSFQRFSEPPKCITFLLYLFRYPYQYGCDSSFRALCLFRPRYV